MCIFICSLFIVWFSPLLGWMCNNFTPPNQQPAIFSRQNSLLCCCFLVYLTEFFLRVSPSSKNRRKVSDTVKQETLGNSKENKKT